MSTDTGSKQRLLIVDDSKVIRITARKILRDHFDTIEAVDGENAWDTLNNEGPFSLVVSDLTMPNLDGFGLLERIRGSQHPDIRDVPVIIITGANDSEATKLRASKAGATDFIGKPFDSVHLLARTQAHANAHTLTDTLRQETFRLEEHATTDPVTGLPNEIAFMDRAYQQLSYAIRHKTTLAIFLIEIDGYLELGRQYGNQASEEMIRSVANALNREVRHEDMAARTGAARFGLLLPSMNLAGIHNLSERISRSISTSPVKQGAERINITASIGVTTPDIRRDTRLDDLLSEAARHLSVARSRGGNQAIFADALNDAAETCPSDITGRAALSAEAIMELVSGANSAEIESDAPQMLEPDKNPADKLPTIECKETTEKPSLPGMFSRAAADRPRMEQTKGRTAAGLEGASTVDHSGIRKPAAPQGKAVFAIDEMDIELDETIIITAPFDIHSRAVPEQARDADRKYGKPGTGKKETGVSQTTAQEQTPAKHLINVQPVADDVEIQVETEAPPHRKGFFRRLFGAMRSPFRRRKHA